MDGEWGQLLLRYSHYLFGIAWLGQVIFMVFVLSPALATLDPAGRGRAMGAVAPRSGMMGGIGALITLITGFILFKQVYLGESGIGMANDRGRWISVGMAAALLMWVIGMAVMMPLSAKMSRGEGDIAAMMKKMKAFGFLMAWLGIVSLIGMLLGAHAPLAFSPAALLGVLALGAAFFGFFLFLSTRIKG